MSWSLSYAEAEHTLAFLHGIKGDVRENAFRARLKHLKRLGIPKGITPGSGAKVFYFEEQLFEWAFCLELAEFGIDPTDIVDLLSNKWTTDIRPHMEASRSSGAEDFRSGNDLFFVAQPSMLSGVMTGKECLPYRWIRQGKMPAYLKNSGHRRSLVFNVSELCRAIGQAGFDFYRKRTSQKLED